MNLLTLPVIITYRRCEQNQINKLDRTPSVKINKGAVFYRQGELSMKENIEFKGAYIWYYFFDDRVVYTDQELDTLEFGNTKLMELDAIRQNIRALHKPGETIEEEVSIENRISKLFDDTFNIIAELDQINLNAESRFLKAAFNGETELIKSDGYNQIDIAISQISNESNKFHEMCFGDKLTDEERLRTMYTLLLSEIRMHIKVLSTKDQITLKTYLIDRIQAALNINVDDKTLKSEIQKIGIKSSKYLKQGPHTNQLALLNTRTTKSESLDHLYDKGTYKIGKLSIYIKGVVNKKTYFDSNTSQLLEMLIVELGKTGCNSPMVHLPVRTYMNLRKVSDRRKARKKLIEQLNNLWEVSMKLESNNDKYSKYANYEIRILGDRGTLLNGNIDVKFNDTFFEMIKAYSVMYYPDLLFSLDERRNPNSYYFLRKIVEHKRINFGRKNADIISVKSLMDSSPNVPSYEDISGKGQIKQRIIKPFERDMNALVDEIDWEFYQESLPISNEEAEKLDIQSFSNLMIHITWKYYPLSTQTFPSNDRNVPQQ